jgi:hypothetical protein
LLVATTAWAQLAAAQTPDSLSFIRSKRIADADLAKKREGRFITGLPDLSSDPVTGVGFGVKSNIYWNGTRANPFFAYTPYLAHLKANVAYYTSNARELSLSADVPYYRGSRWRYRLDFKAQQNPSNLYFGASEATLGRLRLPSDPRVMFETYADYNAARQQLRPGQAGEADFVSDALSNRFRETEFMLNLKADYALGKGRWRVMGGYEIQNLQYKTFTGTATDATDPASGSPAAPPTASRCWSGILSRAPSWASTGAGCRWCKRPSFTTPATSSRTPPRGGTLKRPTSFRTGPLARSSTSTKCSFRAGPTRSCPWASARCWRAGPPPALFSVATRPFLSFRTSGAPTAASTHWAGRQSLRGYRQNRFLARTVAFANAELRVRLADVKLGKQNFGLGVAPFADVGTVRNRWQDLSLRNLKTSYGAGARIAWNLSTIVFADYGISEEDQLFFFGLGQVF